MTTTIQLFAETLPLAINDQGNGRAFLVLHGGAGPASMLGLAGALARQARPDRFTRIDDLVLAYLALLEKLNLSNVIVVGNSVGG